jgi:hypothetical protein
MEQVELSADLVEELEVLSDLSGKSVDEVARELLVCGLRRCALGSC